MNDAPKQGLLNDFQKILLLICALIFAIFLFFSGRGGGVKAPLDQLARSSLNPDLALNNGHPTIFEFYADWCEVCQEMAPSMISLEKSNRDKLDIVFLNVDNQKWEYYIRKFDVYGIPQINLFDREGNLNSTFIGKQEEFTIREFINRLQTEEKSQEEVFNPEFSAIKENKNNEVNPRSHG